MTNSTKNKKIADFEKAIAKDTQLHIKKIFMMDTADSHLYHYTNSESAKSIVESQLFRASFIRSTSDPLEFTPALVHCRNWICADSAGITYKEFPRDLFIFFNKEAQSPSIRPYFCSFTKNPTSEYLKKHYGPSCIHLNPKALPFGGNLPILIKCRYESDHRKVIYELLEDWRINCLEKNLYAFKLDIAETKDEWLYNFMHLSFIISLGIKDHFFSQEEEWRYVAFPEEPDSEQHWHLSRSKQQKKVDGYEFSNEFIPLKMNELGFSPLLITLKS